MNLLKFLQYYNSYNNIGGKDDRITLFEVFKNGWIFHQNDIDQVIGYIRNSTLEETLELIDEETLEKDPISNKKDLVQAVLERSWLTLNLEKKMDSLSEMNYSDPQFAALLFGEPSIEELEEMVLSTEEDLDDVEDLGDEEETEEDDEDTDEEDSDNEEDDDE